MRDLRILVVHNSYRQRGGEDAVFENEVTLLKRKGHDVAVCTETNRLRAQDCLLPWRFVWNPAAYRWVRRTVRQFRPHVVHLHNTFALLSPAVCWAAIAEGVPVVQTLHNFRHLCLSSSLFRKSRPCDDCVERTFPLPGWFHGCWRSKPATTALQSLVNGTHRMLGTWRRTVNLFIVPTRFSADLHARSGFPSHQIVVKPHFLLDPPKPRSGEGATALFLGRISREKGIFTALRAWRRIRELPLHVVGDGPARKDVLAFVARENIGPVAVKPWVPRNEVFSHIRQARFLLFPSETYESFGLVMIEAFACGVPVIASRLGSNPEIVQDGQNGLLFTPGDDADLEKKVRWALDNPGPLLAMGKQARVMYERRFSADTNYDMLMDIYRRA